MDEKNENENYRTPASEARRILESLAIYYERNESGSQAEFLHNVATKMMKNFVRTDKFYTDRLFDLMDPDSARFISMCHPVREYLIRHTTILTAAFFCVEATRMDDYPSLGWICISDANFFAGAIAGYFTGYAGALFEHDCNSVTRLAKLGADAAHKENRAMKREAFAWCDENMDSFRSMDSAAESIAGTLFPVKFRTARSWIGDWKKLHISGKP